MDAIELLPEPADIRVPSITFPDLPAPVQLDSVIRSNGKLSLEQHLARTVLALRMYPQLLWPGANVFKDRYRGKRAIVCGGGPSLSETWPMLRIRVDDGAKVFAPNKSHDWLCDGERDGKRWKRHPVIPEFGVLLDPSLHVANYIVPRHGVKYLLATILHQETYKIFHTDMAECYFWYPSYMPDYSDDDFLKTVVHKHFPDRALPIIHAGSTVGLRCFGLVESFGFTELDLHGFDSCYQPGTRRLYGYDKEYVTSEISQPVLVAPDKSQFQCMTNQHMARQLKEFSEHADALEMLFATGQTRPYNVNVYGDGAIPWMVWKGKWPHFKHATPNRMAEKYGNHRFFDYHNNMPSEYPFIREAA